MIVQEVFNTRPGKLMRWIAASRPRTLPAAAMPVWLAVCLSVYNGADWKLIPALLCLGFALLIQIATNFSNDLEDFRRGADNEKRIGPDRAVQSGWITERTMARAVWITFGLAFVTGSLLFFYTEGYWIFALGIISILAGYAYTGGPYPLGYHGLGDIFSLFFFGLVAVGATYYIQTQELGWTVWLTGLAVGGLTTNLLVVNNHRDMETDRVVGKRTLAVRWSRDFTFIEYVGFVLVAFSWAPLLYCFAGYHLGVFLSWLALPFWIKGIRLLKNARHRWEFFKVLKFTSLALITFGVGAGLGLLLG